MWDYTSDLILFPIHTYQLPTYTLYIGIYLFLNRILVMSRKAQNPPDLCPLYPYSRQHTSNRTNAYLPAAAMTTTAAVVKDMIICRRERSAVATARV